MNIKNSPASYGLISILLHWVMAMLIIGLFILGLFMVELDYYSRWYNVAPQWHKVLGILTIALLLLRILWHVYSSKPSALPTYKQWESISAYLVHKAFYITITIVCISGYFITTGKGASIDMFGWFQIPAVVTIKQDTIEIIGELHELVAWLICILSIVHILASLKHHFIDKDVTLKRIIIPSNSNQQE